MSILRNIAGGLRSLFRKERAERELDEEVRGYLELAAAEKMQQGMSREEARRAVRLEMGNPDTRRKWCAPPGGSLLWRRCSRACEFRHARCGKIPALPRWRF